MRSTLGNSLSYITEGCNHLNSHPIKLSAQCVKRRFRYKEIKENDGWKIPIARELMEARYENQLYIEGFTRSECEDMLKFICIN